MKVHCLPTNYKDLVVRLLTFVAVPSIVYINLSISELREDASSHCSLLWYAKGNVQVVHVNSLTFTSLSSFVHVSSQVSELQEHACPMVMYGPKCFCVVFQSI